MKSTRHIFLSILGFFIGWITINAQNKNCHTYLNTSGISSANVRKIIQDKYGFIWIATQEGLNCFNGQFYKIYSKGANGKKSIGNSDIQDIIEDTSSRLIWLLNSKNIRAIDTYTGLPKFTSSAYSITMDDWNMYFCLADNELWIISNKGVKVFSKKNQTFKTVFQLPVTYHKQDIDTYKNFIFQKNENEVCAVFNGFGMVTINQHSKKATKLQIPFHDYSSFYVKDCIPLTDSTCLLSIANEVLSVSFQKGNDLIKKIFSLPTNGDATETIKNLIADHSDKFNVLSNRRIFSMQQYANGWWVIDTLHFTNDKVLETITCISKDRNKNFWIGYEEGTALVQLQPSAFKAFSFGEWQQSRTAHVNCILPYTKSKMLVGLAHGLITIHPQTNHIDTIEKTDTYYHLFEGPDNTTFVAGANRLSILKGNRLQSAAAQFKELSPYTAFPFIASTRCNDSTMILATENGNGILIWNYLRHMVQQVDARDTTGIHLKENFINTVYTDSQKRVWVLSDNSITILQPDHTTIYLAYPDATTGDALSIYFDVTEHAGYYWLAVYGTGILQLNKKFEIVRTYTTNDGLCNIGVYKLYADSGRIFYTTNKGLGFINIKDGKIYNYFKADGLHGDNFEEASFYAGNRTFYAGGNGGFTQVFPQNISINTQKPPLYITEVKTVSGQQTKDSFTVNMASHRFPSNVQQLTVSFSALNYLNPERTQYFYRIKENNNDWAPLGNTPSLNLYRFPPGTYTLQIKAANEAGIESDIKELQLIFLPHWYETIWLKTAIVLAIAGIFYALYRYRLSQLKAREAIRRKIASDLHDDLGSTLTSIRIFTDLAIRQNPKDFLLQIKQGIQDAMTATRDMIWIMDRTRNNATQLAEKINSFALPLTKANGINLEFQAGKELKDILLKADEQRDLYLIVKEFITNSLKYAGCKKISVQIDKQGKRIAITLCDDGTGFDLHTVKRGKGITNMLARAAAIDYKESLESDENGTILQLIPTQKPFWDIRLH